jgi:dienelactone hydrolase
MVASANAAIREVPVTYTDGETTMKGFVVYDDTIEAKRPGIVMVHEWWGITKHIQNEARKFAQQGYTILIADMYGDAKTADNPNDAGALSASVMKNPTVMESRFNAARDQLARQASVNPQRIGAVGYCFGGAVVLNMARAGADLVAIAGFHATLGLNTPTPAPGTVKAKILVLNGADDPFVKRGEYDALKKDFDAAKADYRVIEYPGAGTRSRIPKPPNSARSSTYRSDTTPRWIRKRRPRLPSSLPLICKSKQKRPPTWWPFLSVAGLGAGVSDLRNALHSSEPILSHRGT